MITDHFDLEEVVCPHVFNKYGAFAWNFFDRRLLSTVLTIRQEIDLPIYVNNYAIGGALSQRGIRCVLCELMQNVYKSGTLFMDPHALGRAWDFNVEGMTAQQVRQWIIENQILLPGPIRLEDKVKWVHLDTYNNDFSNKVVLFNK